MGDDDATMRIGEVARRTGLHATTIRAWQRRYGLLAPARTEGGQRLYSEADVEVLQQVSERVNAGWALPAAAEHAMRTRTGHDATPAGSTTAGGEVDASTGNPRRPGNGPSATDRGAGPAEAPQARATTQVLPAARGDVAPIRDEIALLAVHDAARALLRAATPAMVVAALVDLVEQLGGTVGPATVQSDEVLLIDLGLGETDPLLARAEPFSVARLRLEAVLPGFVEDARRMVALLRTAGRTSG